MTMLRSTRSFLTSSSRAIVSSKPPVSLPLKSQTRTTITPTKSCSIYPKTPISRNIAPIQTAQYVTKTPSGFQQGRGPEEEKKIGQRKLESNPEVVTTESSVRHLYEPDSQRAQKPIRHGIRDDLETVKDTFDLSSVPKEPYFLGLAGTLPYLATSVSTVYLSWDLNTVWPTTSNFLNNILISHDTARQLISVIEPIQLGYGAIIISFLGAVHWGMEYTEKIPNRDRTRFRYGLGVLAPIIAWPTLLMPMDFALTSQFAAFVMLYFADSRATVRAWAPSWYGAYRFVLTAVVGTAIFISLIGRMKVGDAKPRLTGLNEKLHDRGGSEDYTEKWEHLEKKEKEKIEKEKEAEEKKKEEEKKKANENAKKSSSGKDGGKGEKKDEKKDSKADGKGGEKEEDKGEEETKQDDKKKGESKRA
ncbi:hypothetical protein F4813DRAFT_215236 [Daldinia decipiens]|uniref:uncharacterized protein n=1 Tax=Daldinia decipiens TaxID=326647 RepID=UPI0020C30DDB|nr:uncharacterized protein F4813DRAFT_215236 [Daldinia decipiens]KAI1654140.1 hypothetical protein F4813DRAFT_215236 [Daldinia decipiens]